ncbi:MAG: hypothetical protein GX053_01175 [Tissierella sp.]|nr:hypothetical protein [Tissierella sp.]
MNREEIIYLFRYIKVWKRGDQKAVHKPLLILYMLGKINDTRMIAYKTIMEDLKDLLIKYGPTRQQVYTSFPFIRLVNDNIWEIQGSQSINSLSDYNDQALLDMDAKGGFKEEIYTELKNSPGLKYQIEQILLEHYFEPEVLEEILLSVEL